MYFQVELIFSKSKHTITITKNLILNVFFKQIKINEFNLI